MIHLLALVGVLSISFSAVFIRLALVSPVTATFYRGAYAVPVLALVWLGEMLVTRVQPVLISFVPLLIGWVTYAAVGRTRGDL